MSDLDRQLAHHMFYIETCQTILQHKIHQDKCHECTILGRKVTSPGVAMRHGLVGWFRSDKVSQRTKGSVYSRIRITY